jgi:hypothetical protein
MRIPFLKTVRTLVVTAKMSRGDIPLRPTSNTAAAGSEGGATRRRSASLVPPAAAVIMVAGDVRSSKTSKCSRGRVWPCSTRVPPALLHYLWSMATRSFHQPWTGKKSELSHWHHLVGEIGGKDIK